MREELKNLNEMNDSRELLEAKPNPIMPLFIYLIMIILVIAFIWTYFGELDEVVKANGIVRTSETIGTVRNEVADQVEEIHFSEGQQVKAGDILFTLEQNSLKLQNNLMNEDLKKLEARLKNLETLKTSVEKDEDLFTEATRQDNDVYERYTSYQSNVSLLKQELEGSTIEINQSIKEQTKQQESLQVQIENAKEMINELERLKGAIDNQQNVFAKSEAPYYQRYNTINLTISQMEKMVETRKEDVNKLQTEMTNQKKQTEEVVQEEATQETEEVNAQVETESAANKESLITDDQIDESKKLVEQSEYELAQYKNEQLLQVGNEIQQAKLQLEELTATLNSTLDYSDLVDNQQDNFQASLENFKSDTLVQISSDIEALKQQMVSQKQELSTLKEQQNDSVIKAPIDGVVNVKTDISKGEFLPAGTEVLTIVPASKSSTFIVELAVKNQDIAGAKVGDEVNIRIHSLPYQEYGQLYGKITKISTDAVIDPETGMSYYKAEAEIKKEKLYSYKDKEAQIKVGMTADAHIVAGSKKIIYFLLEKIDLRD